MTSTVLNTQFDSGGVGNSDDVIVVSDGEREGERMEVSEEREEEGEEEEEWWVGEEAKTLEEEARERNITDLFDPLLLGEDTL